jgi:hypothetical protein
VLPASVHLEREVRFQCANMNSRLYCTPPNDE